MGKKVWLCLDKKRPGCHSQGLILDEADAQFVVNVSKNFYWRYSKHIELPDGIEAMRTRCRQLGIKWHDLAKVCPVLCYPKEVSDKQ